MFQTMNLVRITSLSLKHEKVFMSSPFILLCCAHTHSIIYVMHVWKEGGGEEKEFNPLLTHFRIGMKTKD